MGGAAAAAQDWQAQDSGTTSLLSNVWFTGPLNGWAVGDEGVSLFTANGGATWHSFFLTGQDLEGVAFGDPSTGLIVGDLGTILFRGAPAAGVEDGIATGRIPDLAHQPNPFAPFTDIRFRLPEAAPIRLVVLDLSGRLVRTLAEAAP